MSQRFFLRLADNVLGYVGGRLTVHISIKINYNDKLDDMNLTLKRTSNEYFYLFGSIFSENNYICDTLEMGTLVAVKEGYYQIRYELNADSNQKELMIFDEDNCVISRFIQSNNYYYHDIEMRKDNNLISVGLRINKGLIHMNAYAMSLLKTGILKAIDRSEIVLLNIKNII